MVLAEEMMTEHVKALPFLRSSLPVLFESGPSGLTFILWRTHEMNLDLPVHVRISLVVPRQRPKQKNCT